MADAPFGKLKNMLPAIGSKKEDHTIDTKSTGEDNSRGQKVSKKQHDVLIQLSIKPQTELDNRVLTPSKVKTVGFHTNDEGGYSFKEVEEFHELVTKTVDWYADKLFERDSDVRKLATEVDKYITDFQNMKIEIELLTSEVESKTVDVDSESKIDSLEEKILRLERENSTLKSQNELLKTQIAETKDQPKELPKKEESPVNGGITNSERQHLQELETWAVEVNVLYENMEASLSEAITNNETLQGQVSQLTLQVQSNAANNVNSESLKIEIANLSTRLDASQISYNELNASYSELQAKFTALEAYSLEAENYSKEMDEYAKGLLAQLEAYQSEEQAPYVEEEPAHRGPAYNLPEGVSLEDL